MPFCTFCGIDTAHTSQNHKCSFCHAKGIHAYYDCIFREYSNFYNKLELEYETELKQLVIDNFKTDKMVITNITEHDASSISMVYPVEKIIIKTLEMNINIIFKLTILKTINPKYEYITKDIDEIISNFDHSNPTYIIWNGTMTSSINDFDYNNILSEPYQLINIQTRFGEYCSDMFYNDDITPKFIWPKK